MPSMQHTGPAHRGLPKIITTHPAPTPNEQHFSPQNYLFESHFGPFHSRKAATKVQDVHPVAQLSAHFKHKPGICDGLSVDLKVRTAAANMKTGKGGRAPAHMQNPSASPSAPSRSYLGNHTGHCAHFTNIMPEGLKGYMGC